MYHLAGLAFVLASACLLAFVLASACLLAFVLASVLASACLLASAGFSDVLMLFCLCCLRLGLPGDSRIPFSLSPSAWSFAFRWLHCFRASDLCRLHLPAGLSFQLPNLQFL